MIILTVLYVIATVFIFGVTAYQIIHYRKELRQRAVLDMVQSNRDILMIGIQNPVLLKVFCNLEDEQEELLSRYAQLWINHAHALWYTHVIVGHIDNEEWKPLKEDIFKMLNQPVIRKRWEKNKQGYPDKFQLFIDSNLVKLHNQADALDREKAVPK